MGCGCSGSTNRAAPGAQGNVQMTPIVGPGEPGYYWEGPVRPAPPAAPATADKK